MNSLVKKFMEKKGEASRMLFAIGERVIKKFDNGFNDTRTLGFKTQRSLEYKKLCKKIEHDVEQYHKKNEELKALTDVLWAKCDEVVSNETNDLISPETESFFKALDDFS